MVGLLAMVALTAGPATAVAGPDGTCRLSYEMKIDGWDADTHVMLPAAAYDGNRAFRRVAPIAPDYGAWYAPSDFKSGKCPFVMHEKIPALASDNSGVGEVFPGPCWSELSFLLIPGITD